MDRNILLRFSSQDLLDAIDNMMRHERLAVIFSNVSVGDDTGLGP
jgi:hypothetical protein